MTARQGGKHVLYVSALVLAAATRAWSDSYELTGFTNILGRLANGVRGEWTFTRDGTATVIR